MGSDTRWDRDLVPSNGRFWPVSGSRRGLESMVFHNKGPALPSSVFDRSHIAKLVPSRLGVVPRMITELLQQFGLHKLIRGPGFGFCS